MLQPAIGIGGKVGVLGENTTRFDGLFELYQKAMAANHCPQRDKEFALITTLGVDRGFAQGRGA